MCGCLCKPCVPPQRVIHTVCVCVCVGFVDSAYTLAAFKTTLTCSTQTPDPSSGAQRIMVLSMEAESRLRGCCSSPPAGGDKVTMNNTHRVNIILFFTIKSKEKQASFTVNRAINAPLTHHKICLELHNLHESNEGKKAKKSISIRFNTLIKIIKTIFWAIFEITEVAYNGAYKEKCHFYCGLLQPTKHKIDHL